MDFHKYKWSSYWFLTRITYFFFLLIFIASLRPSLYIVITCTCIGFHPGGVEPASSRASTASRTIAAHVRWSWARSHEMSSQSRFHRRRPTTWGPDSVARSSLIVLAHVFSCPPTRFRQLGREGGRNTSRMSSPSGRRSVCPNHRRRRWSHLLLIQSTSSHWHWTGVNLEDVLSIRRY